MDLLHFLPKSFKLDSSQQIIIKKLEEIRNGLEKKSFLDFFISKFNKNGFYLYGGVGRGKTMLMQAFYNSLTIKKQIIHYQDFMQSVHKNLHNLQGQDTNKLISNLANIYAQKGKVLCVDEFEIKDITDAMIIGRLFAEFIKCKIFIFVTSNTEPQNLYKDGLQRNSFLPFIDLLNKKFDILYLDNNQDYRLEKVNSIDNRIFYPINDENNFKLNKIIATLTDNQTIEGRIEVFGRYIIFKKTFKNILVTDFNELFLQELGYVDYVNICQEFNIIVLENVPIIGDDNNDLITRFINFIDNAYFYKVLLFASLQDAPEKIYQNGKRIAEFKRTISRLNEMNSDLYMEEVHDKL